MSVNSNRHWSYPPICCPLIEIQSRYLPYVILWMYHIPEFRVMLYNRIDQGLQDATANLERDDWIMYHLVLETFISLTNGSLSRKITQNVDDVMNQVLLEICNNVQKPIPHKLSVLDKFEDVMNWTSGISTHPIPPTITQVFHDIDKVQSIRQSPILRPKCGHSQINSIVTSNIISLPNNILKEFGSKRQIINSWNDGISRLFEEKDVPTVISGRPYCCFCDDYQPSYTRQSMINELSDSLTIQLNRLSFSDDKDDETFISYKTPMIISPVLDMSVHYHAEALKSFSPLSISAEPSKNNSRVSTLKSTLIMMSDVLIDIIIGYNWKPAQYWLQSVLLAGSRKTVKNDQTSLIVRCLPTEAETVDVCHINDNKTTEWWQIDHTGVTPFPASDIFATHHHYNLLGKPSSPKSMPLTHAIALRYQLER